MGLLIDTSVFVQVERGRRPVEGLLAALGGEPVAVAAITASELLHGVERAAGAVHRARRGAWVAAVLEAVPVVPFDLDVARVHARVWADLAARGTLIGSHDLIIAATALHRGDGVLTGNLREFSRVEGLRVAKA